jgi:hypothetical protein
VCDLFKERSISSPQDASLFITSLIGGSTALSDGAL